MGVVAEGVPERRAVIASGALASASRTRSENHALDQASWDTGLLSVSLEISLAAAASGATAVAIREAAEMRPDDTLAEWLRRRPAKPMGSPRVGSNPTGVVFATPWPEQPLRLPTRAVNRDVAFRRRWALVAHRL